MVPRSTVHQRGCSAGSPFSGEGRGLRGSPECVGSPYSCENSLNSSSPQELLSTAPAPYVLPRHLQHSQQLQVYHCTKRKGTAELRAGLLEKPKGMQSFNCPRQECRYELSSPILYIASNYTKTIFPHGFKVCTVFIDLLGYFM